MLTIELNTLSSTSQVNLYEVLTKIANTDSKIAKERLLKVISSLEDSYLQDFGSEIKEDLEKKHRQIRASQEGKKALYKDRDRNVFTCQNCNQRFSDVNV